MATLVREVKHILEAEGAVKAVIVFDPRKCDTTGLPMTTTSDFQNRRSNKSSQPKKQTINCTNCGEAVQTEHLRCPMCGWVRRALPSYADITDALVWTFVLEGIGITLGGG